MVASAQASKSGFDLTLELERQDLLPDRLVNGVARIAADDAHEIRAARITLVGVETWRYDETTTDAQGHPHTETRTATKDLPHVPIELLGPTSFAAGETREFPFQVPVPSLGPPTFEGTELNVDWTLRLNIDVPLFDPSVELPVRVLQPTSLLRAGVVDVAEFALFPEASVEADGLRGTLWLDPVPLCVGLPFRGRLTVTSGGERSVQEVRLELRVEARSTVGGGRQETITVWSGRLAGEGGFGGGAAPYEFKGELPARCLPTLQTEHGRADAAFHVVIAVAMARDPHLVRDVAICSTTEL
jgi:Arrestin (or S-antigen), N-terminal domain